MSSQSTQPIIGILGWEGGNEDTLGALERIPGDIAHPRTWRFPVRYERVPGACYETVVVRPSLDVLAANVEAAQRLEGAGMRAILTNCGFNARFQRELAEAVRVPLFASSLIQVPMVLRMLGRSQRVGIITADREHLTPTLLAAVGIGEDAPVTVRGVEHTAGFCAARASADATLDVSAFELEVVQVAQDLVATARAQGCDIGAFVLECTDLPPFAAAIRNTTRLPVFDIVTLAHMVHESLVGDRWGPAHQTDDEPF